MKQELKKPNGFAAKVKAFVERNKATILTIVCSFLVFAVMASGVVFADEAEEMWGVFADLIKKWVTRLGAVVMFIGGIQFGMGWKGDDAEQKTRGLNTIISGAIVMAVAALTSTFFA